MDPTNRRITDVESLYESLRGALWLHSDLGTRLREAREEPVTVFKVTVFPHPYLVIARPVRFDVRMPLSYPGASQILVLHVLPRSLQRTLAARCVCWYMYI